MVDDNVRAAEKFGVRISTWTVLGAMTGAFSIFSLSEQIIQFGISSFFDGFLDYYRSLFHWFFGFLPSLFNWSPPIWLLDLWTISAIGAAFQHRLAIRMFERGVFTQLDPDNPANISNLDPNLTRLFSFAQLLFFTFSCLGPFFLLGHFFRQFQVNMDANKAVDYLGPGLRNMEEGERQIFAKQVKVWVRIEFALMMGLLLTFFAMNAFGLAAETSP